MKEAGCKVHSKQTKTTESKHKREEKDEDSLSIEVLDDDQSLDFHVDEDCSVAEVGSDSLGGLDEEEGAFEEFCCS